MVSGRRALLLCSVLVAASALGSAQSVVIHNGFMTGLSYRELTLQAQSQYVSGVVDGMFLAPMFGAPKDNLLRFETCITGMRSDQVAAILSKELEDHPESWHEGAHTTLYRALLHRCPK